MLLAPRGAAPPARAAPILAGLALAALVLGASPAAPPAAARDECTAAVLSSAAVREGAPVLWKNRDADDLSNRIVFADEKPYAFLALVNSADRSGRQVYAGLNAAGFAIMNTVAYNLPDSAGEMKDLEGFIMADALRTCRTTADFAARLDGWLGPELGSLANFGVIDADGGAALFEVHNHGCRRLDAAAASERYLVVTNFARSGEAGQGAGYLRFERASALFAAAPPGQLSFADILTRFARDTGHPLLRHPAPPEWRRLPAHEPHWIHTADCPDRSITSAAVVIIGRSPAAPARPATLWVLPGEPLAAVAVPLWVEAGASPAPLWEGDEAPLWRESRRVKRVARPFGGEKKGEYLDLARLDNAEGSGYLPGLLAEEARIVTETAAFLQAPRTPAEYAAFQERQAARALAALRAVPDRER